MEDRNTTNGVIVQIFLGLAIITVIVLAIVLPKNLKEKSSNFSSTVYLDESPKACTADIVGNTVVLYARESDGDCKDVAIIYLKD